VAAGDTGISCLIYRIAITPLMLLLLMLLLMMMMTDDHDNMVNQL